VVLTDQNPNFLGIAYEVVMRLRARVRSERISKSNPLANSNHNPADRAAKIPVPDSVEIEGGHEGGYLLIHIYLREGPFIHNWHSALQEAKDEAKQDFCIQDDEWEPVVEEEP
jgi:hypothetical protein